MKSVQFSTIISMDWYKTAVTPLLSHWSYSSLALLSHRYCVEPFPACADRMMTSSNGNVILTATECCDERRVCESESGERRGTGGETNSYLRIQQRAVSSGTTSAWATSLMQPLIVLWIRRSIVGFVAADYANSAAVRIHLLAMFDTRTT